MWYSVPPLTRLPSCHLAIQIDVNKSPGLSYTTPLGCALDVGCSGQGTAIKWVKFGSTAPLPNSTNTLVTVSRLCCPCGRFSLIVHTCTCVMWHETSHQWYVQRLHFGLPYHVTVWRCRWFGGVVWYGVVLCCGRIGRCGCHGRICEDITLHGFWLCSWSHSLWITLPLEFTIAWLRNSTLGIIGKLISNLNSLHHQIKDTTCAR